MEKQERFKNFNAEFRAVKNDGKRVIKGYAAKFNSRTNLGAFVEVISPGAFAKVLASKPDVRMLRNHDPNFLLGRTTNGTLELWEDSQGLCFTCTLPDTRDAQDVYTLIERGDLSGCSFGFSIAPNGDAWMEDPDGTQVRTIKEVAQLLDASVVTYPAYEDTTVAIARALAEQKEIYVPTPPQPSNKALKPLVNSFVHEDLERWNLLAMRAKKDLEAETCWRDKADRDAQLAWAPEARERELKQVRASNVLIRTLQAQIEQCVDHIRSIEAKRHYQPQA